MFLDASAIVAILVREADGPDLMRRLDRAQKSYVSPLCLYQAILGVARARDVSLQEARATWAVIASSLMAPVLHCGTPLDFVHVTHT